jgi:hypothetical protein
MPPGTHSQSSTAWCDVSNDFTESEEKSVDALYAGSLETFIERRKALVAKLKQAGRVAQSQRVAKFKKPSAVGGRVNGLAHGHGKALANLLDASQRLREVQGTPARSGGVKEAMDKERLAMAKLLDADETLTDLNLRAKVRATVLAHAHGNEELRQQLRRGRIEVELQESSFGFDAASGVAPVSAAPAPEVSQGAAASPGDGVVETSPLASDKAAGLAEEARQEELRQLRRTLSQRRDRIQGEFEQAGTRLRALEAAAEAAEAAAQLTRERAIACRTDLTRMERELLTLGAELKSLGEE